MKRKMKKWGRILLLVLLGVGFLKFGELILLYTSKEYRAYKQGKVWNSRLEEPIKENEKEEN